MIYYQIYYKLRFENREWRQRFRDEVLKVDWSNEGDFDLELRNKIHPFEATIIEAEKYRGAYIEGSIHIVK